MKRFRFSTRVILTLGFIISIPAVLSAQMTWSCKTTSAQWSQRAGQSSIVFHDTMWVMGGTGWNGYEYVHLNDVWYSTNGDSWICATDSAQWQPRAGHKSLVFDDRMWVIGGSYTFYPDYLCLNDVWWSADGINWTPACTTALWLPRRLHTSVVYDNMMWVIGGCTDRNILCNDVWKSTDGNSWVCATNTTWPTRIGHTSVVFHDTMWVMGGFLASPLQDVWYSTDGSNWTFKTLAAGWHSRLSHSSVVFENKMWLMAGTDINYSYNDVWYSTDGDSWICATPSAQWIERASASSVVYNNQIWIMGGSPDVVSLLNDVWYSTGLGVEEHSMPYAEHLMPEIYPNPVKGVMRVRCPLSVKEIKIFDVSGKLIKEIATPASQSRNDGEAVISLKGINPGIYFLRLGKETKKFLIVK